jgi:hypothetical protein
VQNTDTLKSFSAALWASKLMQRCDAIQGREEGKIGFDRQT